jgi:hypothetical protein
VVTDPEIETFLLRQQHQQIPITSPLYMHRIQNLVKGTGYFERRLLDICLQAVIGGYLRNDVACSFVLMLVAAEEGAILADQSGPDR